MVMVRRFFDHLTSFFVIFGSVTNHLTSLFVIFGSVTNHGLSPNQK